MFTTTEASPAAGPGTAGSDTSASAMTSTPYVMLSGASSGSDQCSSVPTSASFHRHFPPSPEFERYLQARSQQSGGLPADDLSSLASHLLAAGVTHRSLVDLSAEGVTEEGPESVLHSSEASASYRPVPPVVEGGSSESDTGLLLSPYPSPRDEESTADKSFTMEAAEVETEIETPSDQQHHHQQLYEKAEPDEDEEKPSEDNRDPSAYSPQCVSPAPVNCETSDE